MGQTRRRRPPMAEINVVPYIDVMLVLLVIFMITAPLLAQGVKVDLPQADAKPLEKDAKDPVIVTVDVEGQFYINIGDDQKSPLEADALVQRVAAVMRLQPDTPVLVRGDKDVNYGAVVRAMTLLQIAGAPSVGLMTDPPERQRR